MRVLVTGGLGYLGSVLRKELESDGIQTRVIDIDYYHQAPLGDGYALDLLRTDIRDTPMVSKQLDGVDAVVHLAAIVGDSAGNLNQEMTIEVNEVSTARLAAECARKGLKMIFASTSSVYGFNGSGLLAEDARTIPLSVYATCKLAAEEAITKALPERSVIFRFGTLFGLSPRMRFDLVVNRFIGQAIQDKRIAVFGGSQLRPFLHVSKAARAIKKALLSDRTGLYNLGGSNMTIMDVAKTVSRLSQCEVKTYPEIKDIRNYAIDSNKAEATFGPLSEPGVEFAFTEISDAYKRGVIRDYSLKTYNNEEMLREAR